MGPASLCSAADRRSPLQEGCLKSKLPARHLLLRRSVSQQQNQQKQLFIPFDVGFEVTPPLPLCHPTTTPFLHPSFSSPSPSSSLYLLLPRKQGHASFSVKGAALKEQEFQNRRLFLILHRGKCVAVWGKSSLSVVQLIATPLSLSGCKCHFHSVMFYTTKEFHRITAVSWHNVIIHGHFCIVLLLKILQLIKMWIASHGAQIGTLVTRFRLPSEWQSHWYLANKKSVLWSCYILLLSLLLLLYKQGRREGCCKEGKEQQIWTVLLSLSLIPLTLFLDLWTVCKLSLNSPEKCVRAAFQLQIPQHLLNLLHKAEASSKGLAVKELLKRVDGNHVFIVYWKFWSSKFI